MALEEGVNAGFVTTAPTADPAGDGTNTIDDAAHALKVTAPANGTVTEIGWWCDTASQEANFEVGLYTDDGGGATSLPSDLIDANQTNAKGTGAGWKTSTVSIPITSGTIYWIAVQLDNVSTTTLNDAQSGIMRRARKTSQTTLTDPWGAGSSSNNAHAIYALYSTTFTFISRLALIGVG